jgi:hypothetical protein
MDSFNSTAILVDPLPVDSNFFAADASDWGLGVYYNGHWFMKEFSATQRLETIAWREIYALYVALKLFGEKLSGKSVEHAFTDNTNAEAALNRLTTKVANAMPLVRGIHFMQAKWNFRIKVSHISSKDNVITDLLSRNDLLGCRLHCAENNIPLDKDPWPWTGKNF